jgi:hypothetical protein
MTSLKTFLGGVYFTIARAVLNHQQQNAGSSLYLKTYPEYCKVNDLPKSGEYAVS